MIDSTNDCITATLSIDLAYYKTGFVLPFKKKQWFLLKIVVLSTTIKMCRYLEWWLIWNDLVDIAVYVYIHVVGLLPLAGYPSGIPEFNQIYIYIYWWGPVKLIFKFLCLYTLWILLPLSILLNFWGKCS